MEPLDTQVNMGDVAVFECSVSQPTTDGAVSQNVVIEWRKDDQPLSLDHRRKALPSGILEINDVRLSDRAQYHCVVTDQSGSSQTSRSAWLRVNLDMTSAQSPMAPRLVSSPKNTKAYGEGGTVTLNCAANGYPRPYITWLKDGSTIDLNHLDSRFTRIGQGSLQIRSVHVGDEGTYQCRAENTEDSIDAAAILDVFVVPKFIKTPENAIAFEKEDVKLDCEVYGRPQVTVQWYKNGDLIVESEYFQVINYKLNGSRSPKYWSYPCRLSKAVVWRSWDWWNWILGYTNVWLQMRLAIFKRQLSSKFWKRVRSPWNFNQFILELTF